MKIVITYIDDENEAKRITEALLNDRLAACVSIFPCKSRYWWKNEIHEADEFILFIKTKENLIHEVIEKIKELHKYELPVIDVIDVEKTNKGVDEWVNEVTKK